MVRKTEAESWFSLFVIHSMGLFLARDRWFCAVSRLMHAVC